MATPPMLALPWLFVWILLVEEVHGTATWCVVRSDASQQALQRAIDYACGAGGADCSPIQPTGLCYLPNTLPAHASYAFNSYYQRKSMAPGTCNFAATATIAVSDPSYGSCVYPSSLSKAGGTVSTTPPSPTTTTSTSTVPAILPLPPAAFTVPTIGSSIPSSGAAASATAIGSCRVSLLPVILLIIGQLLPEIV